MSTDLNASFNEQYMNINTKLKKRFMRKPNISEATNEFIALAIQCEHSEQPAFAGHAYVGAAKCESTVGNFLGEAEHYLAAARQFMNAEKKLSTLKFYSPDRENLEAAIGCYMQAINKYPEKSSIRVSILLELANDLIALNHKLEALAYYEQALDVIQDSAMRIMHMRNLVNLQIDCERFEDALETSNKICTSNYSIPEDLLSEIQLNRILLTLLVQPSEESKSESLKQLFNDLVNDENVTSSPFSVDVKLKLQSIVISSAAGDSAALIRVAAETKQYLTPQQTDMIDVLISGEKLEKSIT